MSVSCKNTLLCLYGVLTNSAPSLQNTDSVNHTCKSLSWIIYLS